MISSSRFLSSKYLQRSSSPGKARRTSPVSDCLKQTATRNTLWSNDILQIIDYRRHAQTDSGIANGQNGRADRQTDGRTYRQTASRWTRSRGDIDQDRHRDVQTDSQLCVGVVEVYRISRRIQVTGESAMITCLLL